MSAAVIEAHGLAKNYGATQALAGLDFTVESGRIVGLIGRNGAGKTTALKSVLGLTPFDGSLRVLGYDPFKRRHELMQQVSFIADVAVLPPWIRVGQLLDYVAASHPGFDRERAAGFLDTESVRLRARVRTLSKGMVTQLHLAIVMAIDTSLLVLDEPTLGLDIVYRKMFYSTLLNDYFDHSRTILVTTHQVEEVEHILTDVVFIERGGVILEESVETIGRRYVEVAVDPERLETARRLGPFGERRDLGQPILMFEDKERAALEALGEVRQPRLADLFVAKVAGGAS